MLDDDLYVIDRQVVNDVTALFPSDLHQTEFDGVQGFNSEMEFLQDDLLSV